ncbi:MULTISPECIES: LexA family transcriptional regulator [Hyphobacterium]|uniref:LexA family transcriptional regulator n=1 Tax=Hyphobacterium vulgare TaxID=1736751 RepID=A0ABV6ZUC5_9PROT
MTTQENFVGNLQFVSASVSFMSESDAVERGKRLRQARERAGFERPKDVIDRFSRRGVKTSYYQHEKGSAPFSFKYAQLYGLLFGVKPEWLYSGQGPMADGDVVPIPDSSHVEPVTVTLPLIGEAQAGAWKEVAAIEEADAERIPVPAEHRIPGARQYWIRVVGDSVDRFMPEGSLALCTDVWSWARDAEDFMARADAKLVLCRRVRHGLYETTIKQLKVMGEKAELWPASHNPRHNGPIDLGADLDGSEVQIQAVVTHALIRF